MSGVPVVIAANGLGAPVRPVESGAPLLTIADNGLGVPIVISERSADRQQIVKQPNRRPLWL